MLFFELTCPNSAPPSSEMSSATERVRKAIFFFVISAQPFLRIFGAIVLTDLKIEEAAGCFLTLATILANPCNRLARGDSLANGDIGRFQVPVQ